ncbi:MAG: OsmC family peroxiredoxin [Deltaproteobacteria bacterium]|nr:MAG: OsmC family peroxiredoxin [Deltaproteobacteria bacterium]
MNSTLTHTDGMAFDVAIGEHSFTIDAKPEHGGHGTGPNPKALLLASLGGCSAMDIVSILDKMRQPYTKLVVSVDAEITTPDHPKVFDDFTVHVEVEGEVVPKKLWKAVALSRDRYCGVAEMLRAHAPVTFKVVLNGEEVPEP